MTAWIDRAFHWAASPAVAATAAGAATAAILLRPVDPITDLLLVAAVAGLVALALTRRGLWAVAALPFLLLLADRPGPAAGFTTLPSGAATETYTVRPTGGPARLHHLGFWLEDLVWDASSGAGTLQLRDAALEDRVPVPLAAGQPVAVGRFVLTPSAAGRGSAPASVKLHWSVRGGDEQGTADVAIGGTVELPGGRTLKVTETRAAFNRQGPAIRIDDGAGDLRWLFLRYPEHDALARTGPVAVRWTDSTPASVVRFEVRPAGVSTRSWLAEHPVPPVALLAALLLGLFALRGRPRSVAAALVIAAAIWLLPGRTAPRLGGELSSPPYASGELVTVDLQVGPTGGPADVTVPMLLRLPVGGAGAVLGGAGLLVGLALIGFALGGGGVTHGRSALRAAGLLLAALALFLAVRPWLGPVPEVSQAQVDAAVRMHAPAPPGRDVLDWSPSLPGPYSPGPFAPDLALLGLAAVAGLVGARRR